jgi:hypothetical protein
MTIIIIFFILYSPTLYLDSIDNDSIEHSLKFRSKRWLYWRVFEVNNMPYDQFKLYLNYEINFRTAFQSEIEHLRDNPLNYINTKFENRVKRHEWSDIPKDKYFRKNYGLDGIYRPFKTRILNFLDS